MAFLLACREAAAEAIAQVAAQRCAQHLSASEAKAANAPKAYIVDYGGTLDTRGEHWSRVIWRGYEHAQVPITWEQFWEAYKLTERRLGEGDIIRPTDTFLRTLQVKLALQSQFLAQPLSESVQEAIVKHIYKETQAVTAASRHRLHALHAQGIPMVLVSNFYGNIETVLHEFGLAPFISEIIESARVGIRKPDPRLWQLGIEAVQRIQPTLRPADMMVVGDTLEKDILPAQSLGCQTFHVTPDRVDFLASQPQ